MASTLIVPHRTRPIRIIRLPCRRVATRLRRRRTIESGLLQLTLLPTLGRLGMAATTLHQPLALERLWVLILEILRSTEALRKTPSRQSPDRLPQGSRATTETTESERSTRTKTCSASAASQKSPSILHTSKNINTTFKLLITNKI